LTPRHHVDQCRFSGSAAAEQRDALPLPHGEIDPGEAHDPAVTETTRDVFKTDQRRGLHHQTGTPIRAGTEMNSHRKKVRDDNCQR